MNTPFDERFDERARTAHAGSLDALSPRVQAQLAQRRRAALSPTATRSAARRWRWLGAAATAGALVVALQLRPPVPVLDGPVHAVAATAALPADPGSVLVEDPDFYLWLASRESQALAME